MVKRFALVSVWLFVGCARCVVGKNERADFYPTPSRFNEAKKAWEVTLEGRIYEPKENAAIKATVASLRILNLAVQKIDTRFVDERLASLFAENKKGRRVRLQFSDRGTPAKIGKTNSVGQFEKQIEIPADRMTRPDADGFASYSVSACAPQEPSGFVQLLASSGTSVISTVDDTLKITGSDAPAAAAVNSLLRRYESVPGMARLYQDWHAKGAAFHYVSGMPRELYPSFARFLAEGGFPKGSIELRTWSLQGESLLDKMDQLAAAFNDESFKNDVISKMLEQFPNRRFILVGNSVSNDPEVMGELAYRYPSRVSAVYILDPMQADTRARLETAFREVPKEKWHVFRKPAELTTAL